MRFIEGFTLQEIYEQAEVAKFNVSFEQFERDPLGTLVAIGQYDAIHIMKKGDRPLRYAQVIERQKNEHRWALEHGDSYKWRMTYSQDCPKDDDDPIGFMHGWRSVWRRLWRKDGRRPPRMRYRL